MMKKLLVIVGVISSALTIGTPAQAQNNVTLQADVKLIRMVDDNGATRETLEEPSKVVPGDSLVFRTAYNNDTGTAADNVVVTNPLPAAVKLAKDGDFEVSVDGGNTFGPLTTRRISDAQGSTRAASLDDVTHVRWTLKSVGPGENGQFEYFATVR